MFLTGNVTRYLVPVVPYAKRLEKNKTCYLCGAEPNSKDSLQRFEQMKKYWNMIRYRVPYLKKRDPKLKRSDEARLSQQKKTLPVT